MKSGEGTTQADPCSHPWTPTEAVRRVGLSALGSLAVRMARLGESQPQTTKVVFPATLQLMKEGHTGLWCLDMAQAVPWEQVRDLVPQVQVGVGGAQRWAARSRSREEPARVPVSWRAALTVQWAASWECRRWRDPKPGLVTGQCV